MTLRIIDTQHNNDLHYAECRILFIVMLSVIMLNVVMLGIVAPFFAKAGKGTLDRYLYYLYL